MVYVATLAVWEPSITLMAESTWDGFKMGPSMASAESYSNQEISMMATSKMDNSMAKVST